MHKLMRYIRQNRKKIIKVALMVAFLILLLQLLNSLAIKEKKEDNRKNENEIFQKSNGTIKTDKSAVSGGKIPESELGKVNDKIEEFVRFCNEGNIEGAYNLLTESCKEKFYPNIESFRTYYYEPLFKEGQRTYTIENWIKDIYMVSFKGDLLATGKSSTDFIYQDYITIETVNDEKKLNINKYIGEEEINKAIEKDNIKMTVLCRYKHMEYEEYEIEVTNNTKGAILLDQLLYSDTIYLQDSNKTNHIALSNEIYNEDMQINKGHTKKIKIKFDNPYISNRKIKKICFSDVILNYDINNKASLEKTKLVLNF